MLIQISHFLKILKSSVEIFFTCMRSSSYSDRTDVQQLFLNTILNMVITSGSYVETLSHSICYGNSNNMVSIFYYIQILCFILFKPCLKITKKNKYKLKITHYANFLGQKEEKTSFSLSFAHSLSLSHTHTYKIIAKIFKFCFRAYFQQCVNKPNFPSLL